MPPEFTGGLGPDGVRASAGICRDRRYARLFESRFELRDRTVQTAVRNVVAGLPRTEYYVPGSILRIELDTTHPIAQGMPKETIAWAEDSPVFEVTNDPQATVPASNVRIIASYPADKDPLLSGWLLGGDESRAKPRWLK